MKLLITCRQKLADLEDDPGDSVFTPRLGGNILEVMLGRLSVDDAKVLLKRCAGDVSLHASMLLMYSSLHSKIRNKF